MTTRERPIPFSAAMVRAVLDGRKTQTRRVIPDRVLVKLQPDYIRMDGVDYCPYGQPGDRLWVKETWARLDDLETADPGADALARGAFYHADNPWGLYHDDCNPMRWRSARFMPRRYSRLTLEITGVRVERVQSISASDCYAEGVKTIPSCQSAAFVPGTDIEANGGTADARYRDCFRQLWDSINEKRGYGWDDNPWVWAIEFRRVA